MKTASKPADLDKYINGFPPETQQLLTEVRSIIRKNAKDAEEAISYGIPTFYLDGHYLIYFAGFKKHISIYPAPRGVEPFKTLLAPYKGGKGTVQFPIEAPLPASLITKIVKYRIRENRKRKLK